MCCQNFDTLFADNVARLCYEKFETLLKSGKPVQNQWTHLSAIVMHYNNELKVISIATGSKCIGKLKLSPSGDIINDSHAEVLARRGLLKYFYEQIISAKSRGESHLLIAKDDGMKYHVRPSVSFHLFSTHVPCGDAAIFPLRVIREVNNETDVNDLKEKGVLQKNEIHCSTTKKKKLILEVPSDDRVGVIMDDIHRTGAKCLAEERNPDKKLSGPGYHVIGCVRTKPGRGDPTLSVSCSDKILRWNCVGIQGALLSLLLLDPVYLSSIIIGSHDSLYSHDALRRAVIDRNAKVTRIVQRPVLLHSSVEFKFCRRLRSTSAKPAPCGIVWCDVAGKNQEVIVEGRRLGWTKKTALRIEPLSITKKIFFHTFKSITGKLFSDLSYHNVKLQATVYQDSWKNAKTAIGSWTEKNVDLIQFK